MLFLNVLIDVLFIKQKNSNFDLFLQLIYKEKNNYRRGECGGGLNFEGAAMIPGL